MKMKRRLSFLPVLLAAALLLAAAILYAGFAAGSCCNAPSATAAGVPGFSLSAEGSFPRDLPRLTAPGQACIIHKDLDILLIFM